MVALKSSKITLKTVAVIAALSSFASLQLSSADRALAWGTGGGGGGGGAASPLKDKDEEKDAAKRRYEIQDKLRAKLKQQRDDSQYKPGFAFGPGGDMNLQR